MREIPSSTFNDLIADNPCNESSSSQMQILPIILYEVSLDSTLNSFPFRETELIKKIPISIALSMTPITCQRLPFGASGGLVHD